MTTREEFEFKMQQLLGSDTPKFFASLEQPIQKAITVNFDRMPQPKFEKVADFEFSSVPTIDNAYTVGNFKIGNHPLHHLGIIYSQEPSAMFPVEMLDIQEGDIVLDLCSAPGGKSIQILEKLHSTGLLVSNEIVYNRAKILYENLNRMGFKNFIITCNSPEDFETTNLKFDKILVDAPCGGEGMFRRADFDFESYKSSSIETNAVRQLSILNSAKKLLKKGGKLVYSTCTYDIRENEDVIAKFISQNPEFSILECPKIEGQTVSGIRIDNLNTEYCRRRYPHLFDGEGQFMALLQKDGEEELESNTHFNAKGFSELFKKDAEILNKDLKGVFNYKQLDLVKRGNSIFALPEVQLDMEDLNVLSCGILLGTLDKNGIKISHEFYHTYGDIFSNTIELNNAQVVDYLKGLELDISADFKGICAVKYLGSFLGGGKVANDKLKNYYPKNLRIN